MLREDTIFADAESGDPYARLGVAYLYQHGKLVEQNYDLAVDWYMRAAENGCSRAKWELAKAFRDGVIAMKSDEYYLYYLKKAASAGIPEARFELALLNLGGKLLPQNPRAAFNWMRLAANQNFTMAEFLLGYMHGKGIGTPVDAEAEETMYSRVALHGNADLFYRIGRNFEYGLYGLEKDLAEAGRWYKNGSDMGHEACYICWQFVLAGGKDESLEEREFRLSHTEAAKEKAKTAEAMAFADGCLDAEDYGNAIKGYEEAAGYGSAVAMFTLALIYHNGDIVKRNDQAALNYMTKASLAGSEDAQYIMGTLYERGRGVNKDPSEAIKYYAQAAANGYLAAYHRLAKYMDHPEIYVRNTMPTILR